MLEGASGRFHRVDSSTKGDCPVCFQAPTPEENVAQSITSSRDIHERCIEEWNALPCRSDRDCVLWYVQNPK